MHNIQKKCPYCKAQTSLLFKGKDYNRKVSSQVFLLRKCKKCDLRFISNPPKNLDKYYTTDYHYIPKNYQELEAHLPAQQFKINELKKFKTKGNLLEIGPSIGQFCALAKPDFNVTAIEMDAKCVDFLNNHVQIEAIQSSTPEDQIKKLNKKFDAICLWHSIEHLLDPFTLLDQCIKHLNKDGILLIAAPNPKSIQAKIMWKFWPHHDLPRHLFAFPINWFKDFATNNNLRFKYVTTQDEGSRFWNKFSWDTLIQNFYPFTKGKQRLNRYATKIINIISKYIHNSTNGDCYIIVLQK